MYRTLLARPVVGILIASGLIVATQEQAAQSVDVVDPLEECVATYTNGSTELGAGQERESLDEATVVGGRGLALKKQGGEVAVVAADDSDAEAMADKYKAQGRSVLKDARAAGAGKGLVRKLCKEALGDSLVADAGGTIIDSICVSDKVDYVEWDGCTTRYRITNDGDPNWTYGIDDSQATGHETESLWYLDLTRGGVKNSYATSNVDITKASPGSDLFVDNACYESSFGIDILGFGASTGGTVCPERWNITLVRGTTGTESHKTQWEGESHNDREAVAVTGYRVKPGTSSHYTLYINWST